MNTLEFLEFNYTIKMNKVSIFVNESKIGYIAFNDGRKITALKYSHIAKFELDNKEVILYAKSQEDATMKVRKYLLDYDVYEA